MKNPCKRSGYAPDKMGECVPKQYAGRVTLGRADTWLNVSYSGMNRKANFDDAILPDAAPSIGEPPQKAESMLGFVLVAGFVTGVLFYVFTSVK